MYTVWKSRYCIGGVQTLNIGVPAFGAVHMFLSSPPCVIMRFLCLSAPLRRARAVRPIWPALRYGQNRVLTPLMSYSWFCHWCYSNASAVHIYTHAGRNCIAFARSVFRSFDFIFCTAHLKNQVLAACSIMSF